MPNQSVNLDIQRYKTQNKKMYLRKFLRRIPETLVKIKNAVANLFRSPEIAKKTEEKKEKKKRISKNNEKNIIINANKRRTGMTNSFKKVSIKKKYGISFKKVSELHHRQRFLLRKQYPYLPEYIFLSGAQKKKFFQQKNELYFAGLKSNKKEKKQKISFVDKAEVLIFDKELPPNRLLHSEKIQENIIDLKNEDLINKSEDAELQSEYSE